MVGIEKTRKNSGKLGLSSSVDLSIIVVSFNTREMTLECLKSVFTQTQSVGYEIIVVDNDSSDNSADAIRNQFPDVSLIALKENIGFACANNLAAEKANGRRILLLNPDTVVLDRAIDHLVAFADENPTCGIWGGRTVFADGSLNIGSCWRKMSVWSLFCTGFGFNYLAPNSRIFNYEAYGGWPRDTVQHVDIVQGSFFLIDRKLWNQLGGFDPKFFMYGEEADLCIRAYQRGARPLFTPSATIIHYGSAAEISAVNKRIQLFKAKVTLINRHWSPLTRYLGRTLLILGAHTRLWIYWLAAKLTGRSDLAQIVADWQMFWQRRSDWISGYR